jgi:hypothetical protein
MSTMTCCQSRIQELIAAIATGRAAETLAAIFLGGLLSTGAGWAQTEPLFLSDGDGYRILVVQGGAIVNSFPASPVQRAFPIAIIDQVRTTGYALGETGAEYTLAGVPTGATYALGQGGSQ